MGKVLQNNRLTNKQLLNIVAEYYEITPDLVAKRDKSREVSDARFVYYRLLKDKGYTLKFIGKIVGGRTHTAVKNGLDKINDVKEINTAYEKINFWIQSNKNDAVIQLDNVK